MKALEFSPAAEADLAGIWRYSAKYWGPDQADRYTEEMRGTCHALTTGQKQGRAADARPGYLKCTCGAHVIFYRDRDESIQIIRILHQKQDAERHLHR